MSEIEKQLTIVPEQSSDDVVKKQRKQKNPLRPKIKRRAVVDGKPKLGRPTKAAIDKKRKPGLIGRPPGSGDGARIAEFKARPKGVDYQQNPICHECGNIKLFD